MTGVKAKLWAAFEVFLGVLMVKFKGFAINCALGVLALVVALAAELIFQFLSDQHMIPLENKYS